jgi:hypothetical protein
MCDNNKLVSLVGAPQEIDGSFSCMDNQLTTLDGAPRKVGRHFYCTNNSVKFTRADVKSVVDVFTGGIIV